MFTVKVSHTLSSFPLQPVQIAGMFWLGYPCQLLLRTVALINPLNTHPHFLRHYACGHYMVHSANNRTCLPTLPLIVPQCYTQLCTQTFQMLLLLLLLFWPPVVMAAGPGLWLLKILPGLQQIVTHFPAAFQTTALRVAASSSLFHCHSLKG